MQTATQTRENQTNATGHVMPTIALPSEDDMKPLYDLCERYSETCGASWNLFNEIKARVFREESHENHSRGAAVAYADPEMNRLKCLEQELYERIGPVRKAIDGRFPGLELQCPASYLGWGAPVSKYRASVHRSLRSYVESKWYEANREATEKLRREMIGAPVVEEFRVGMYLYSRKAGGTLVKVEKITHHGKRIIVRSLLDGETTTVLRPTDRDHYKSSGAIADRIAEFYDSRKETLAHYCPDELEMEAVQ
jgi:hypothetical protein